MNTDKIYAQQIANEYAPKEASRVKALHRLDSRAKRPARVTAYTLGVLSTLALGVGMCLSMGVIGDGGILSVIIGVAVGSIGILFAGVNYYIYKAILAKSKNKYASDIIRLADEIVNEG